MFAFDFLCEYNIIILLSKLVKYIYFYNIVIIIAILKICFLKYLIKYLQAYNLLKLLQMLLMKSLTLRAFLLTYESVEIAA